MSADHEDASESGPQQASLRKAALEAVWSGIAQRRFEMSDFLTLISLLGADARKGSFLREAARIHRTSCEDEDTRPAALVLENLEHVPKTTRIDGVIPFRIPLASDIVQLVDDLLDHARSAGLSAPVEGPIDWLRRDLELCALAFLHGRDLLTDAGSVIEMRVECPGSTVSRRREELLLIGYLPNGRRAVLFYSGLKSRERLAMPPAAVEHTPFLTALRDAQCQLRLHSSREAPRGIPGQAGDRHGGYGIDPGFDSD